MAVPLWWPAEWDGKVDDCPEGTRASFHEQVFSAGGEGFASLDKVGSLKLNPFLTLSHLFFFPPSSKITHYVPFFSPVQSNGVADTLKWNAAPQWETKENTLMEGWNDMWFGYQCRDSFDWSEAQEKHKSNHRELLQISEGRIKRQTWKCLCRWRQRLLERLRTLSTEDMFNCPLSQNCSVPCRILVGTISERIFVSCMKSLKCFW